jgi:NitT/TauT family transport system ATP-binding protein
VPFARPRAVYDLKGDPEYARMSRAIWLMLREEVVGP